MTSITMQDIETPTMTRTGVWRQLQDRQSRKTPRPSELFVTFIVRHSSTTGTVIRPDSTQYDEPTLLSRNLDVAASCARRMDETFSKIEETPLSRFVIQPSLEPTTEEAAPPIDPEWALLMEEFGPPNYEKMSQEVKAYMAERGKDMDELLRRASVLFNSDQPPIRQRRLTPEEIQRIIQEENDAF